MPKRRESGFDFLASMPWPVPIALGILAYIGIRYGSGWLFGSSQNICIVGLAKQLSSDAFAP